MLRLTQLYWMVFMDEILCRLFLIDDLYTKYGRKNILLLNSFKNSVARLTLTDIENDLIQRNGKEWTATWFLQYKHECCKYIEIDPTKCVLDDRHSMSYVKAVPCAAGTPLTEIIEKDFVSVHGRVFDLMGAVDSGFMQSLPPIVKCIGEKYEVRMGNHRIMAAILAKKSTIKVLTFADSRYENVIKSMGEL